jgi:hypothetical protein
MATATAATSTRRNRSILAAPLRIRDNCSWKPHHEHRTCEILIFVEKLISSLCLSEIRVECSHLTPFRPYRSICLKYNDPSELIWSYNRIRVQNIGDTLRFDKLINLLFTFIHYLCHLLSYRIDPPEARIWDFFFIVFSVLQTSIFRRLFVIFGKIKLTSSSVKVGRGPPACHTSNSSARQKPQRNKICVASAIRPSLILWT